MNPKRFLVIVVLAAGGAVAWWLGSPLFLDERVDEAFPMTRSAQIPDSITRAEAEEVMTAAAAETRDVAEPMPEGEPPTELRRGRFRDVDRVHRGSGSATIYRLATGEHVLRLEDFEVTNGPDLRVLLAGHPDPVSRGDLDGGGYVELAPLKGNVGNQNYVIPPGLDVSAQGSVVIYCRPFHVLFSVAPLG